MKPAELCAKFSPQHLFAEWTFLRGEWIEAIAKRCLECDAVPLIHYYPPMKCHVFHALCINGLIYKKECTKLFRPPAVPSAIERDFEDEILAFLTDRGVSCRRQVPCEAGVADIVTDSAVIEIKMKPGHSEWLRAIGQAIAYRASLGVTHAAIISVSHRPLWVSRACQSVNVSCFTRKTIDKLADYLSEGAIS